MNKIFVFVIVFSLLVLSSAFVFSENVSAHSPQDMELEYDLDNGQLNVTITHNVDNPDSHYVERIVIQKNGNEYDTFDYDSQPSGSSFTYNYQVEAEEGDTINVEGICNQVGNVESTIEVTEEGGTTVDEETPFIGIPLVVTSTILAALILKKKGE